MSEANDGYDTFKGDTYKEAEEKLTRQDSVCEKTERDMKEIPLEGDTIDVLPGCNGNNERRTNGNITEETDDKSDKHILSSNEEDEVASYPANAFSTKTSRDDFILRVEDKPLYVNKMVLSLFSTVFNDIINDTLKEQNRNELTLTGKKYDDVLEFLQCMYPNITKPITMENVYVVLPLIYEYQVPMLKSACELCLLKYLAQKETPTDLYEVLDEACYYKLEEVKEKCIDIVVERPHEEYEGAENKFTFSDDAGNKIRKKVLQNLKIKYKDVFGHVQTTRALYRLLGSAAKQNDLVHRHTEGSLIGDYTIMICNVGGGSANINVDGIPFQIVVDEFNAYRMTKDVIFRCQATGNYPHKFLCAVVKINQLSGKQDYVCMNTLTFENRYSDPTMSVHITEASFCDTVSGFCRDGCIKLYVYMFKYI